MTFEEIRNHEHINVVPLYKDEKEIAKHLKKLGLGENAAVVLVSLLSRKRTQFDLMQIFLWEKSKGNKKSKNKIQKQKLQFKVAEGLSELREVFLFNWEDDNVLIDFLHQNYDLKWVETAGVERIDDGGTIKVSDGNNHLTLSLGDNWRSIYGQNPNLNSWKWRQQEYSTEVKLIIDDGRRDEFEGKMIGRPAKLKIFRNRGWLAEREVTTSREVGVYKVYSLKIPFGNIIAELVQECRNFDNDMQKKIDKLRKSL